MAATRPRRNLAQIGEQPRGAGIGPKEWKKEGVPSRVECEELRCIC